MYSPVYKQCAKARHRPKTAKRAGTNPHNEYVVAVSDQAAFGPQHAGAQRILTQLSRSPIELHHKECR
jgi:hypothetical protein